jgi:hypothetical protein
MGLLEFLAASFGIGSPILAPANASLGFSRTKAIGRREKKTAGTRNSENLADIGLSYYLNFPHSSPKTKSWRARLALILRRSAGTRRSICQFSFTTRIFAVKQSTKVQPYYIKAMSDNTSADQRRHLIWNFQGDDFSVFRKARPSARSKGRCRVRRSCFF